MHANFISPDIEENGKSETGYNAVGKNEKLVQKKPNTSKPSKGGDLDISFAVFKKQPPDNLRKSNFFHFDLIFYDSQRQEVIIEKGKFDGFLEDKEDEKKLRNGIIYELMCAFSNGKKQKESILVRLIDSSSKKPISYDGQDKNPDMCRVLLTHEVMCRCDPLLFSRCCDNKSCGNRNETPSDPSLLNNGYFMKCNQNCLKNAGNPRETRRFQVLIALICKSEFVALATSENMFVHNNSKHGRRSTANHDGSLLNGGHDMSLKLPFIHHVIPQMGRISGNDEIAIIGENFFEGLNLAFGTTFAFQTEVLSSNLIRVRTPPCVGPMVVEIKFVHDCRILQRGNPLLFKYNPDNFDVKSEYLLEKLWSLLPKQSTEVDKPPKDLILCRAAETLEYIIANNSLVFNPTENGQSMGQSVASSVNYSIAVSTPSNNGKDSSHHNSNKQNHQVDGVKYSAVKNMDYVRQGYCCNGQNGYDTSSNNQNYVMGPVIVGMNQVCDPVSANAPNIYIPYPNVYETPQIAVNMACPVKRPYSNDNTMLTR